MTIVVEGMREFSAALAKADRTVRLGWRHGMREVAEPVRRDAEALAQERIPRIGDRWYRMRTGITRNLVYVAPREKGARKNPYARRPNFAPLMMGRAMEPALEMHEADIERGLEHLLDVMVDEFNYGGPM